MNREASDQMSRAVTTLRGAIDATNAVVEDMLRPPRMRQFGHILQRDNYGDARGKFTSSFAFVMRCVNMEPIDPADPAGSGGAGPTT